MSAQPTTTTEVTVVSLPPNEDPMYLGTCFVNPSGEGTTEIGFLPCDPVTYTGVVFVTPQPSTTVVEPAVMLPATGAEGVVLLLFGATLLTYCGYVLRRIGRGG